MKYPVRRLFAMLSLVMTLTMVQLAWSGIAEIGELITITGTVYECDRGASGIQIDTGEEIISVYGRGPARYWVSEEVDFPEVGETVTIYAYEITFSDGTGKLVVQSMDLDADGVADIYLRDDNGVPLWRPDPLLESHRFRHQHREIIERNPESLL